MVDRDQRRPLRGEDELVTIGIEAVTRVQGRDDVIRAVEDIVDAAVAAADA